MTQVESEGVSALPSGLTQLIAEFQWYLRLRAQQRAHVPSGGRALIQAIAEELAGSFSGILPVDPFVVARRLDVDVKLAPASPHGQLGKLIPVSGGFRAVVFGSGWRAVSESTTLPFDVDENPSLNNRGRFTLAHELAHTLFYSRPRAHETPRRIMPADASRNSRWHEEGLCHEFARALLLPSSGRSIVAPVPTPQAIIAGSTAFRVSREAFVRRVIYDWKMWPATSFLHVSLFGDRPRAQILRGSRAAARRIEGRTEAEHARQLEHRVAPSDVISYLEKSVGARRDRMIVSQREIWAILT